MAVYTEVTDEALAAFLADYDIGTVVAFRGIAEGVENSNYSLRTTAGDFILTLYEKRVDPAELPWFLGLMEHLAEPRHHLPAAGRAGATALALRQLAGRPACDHHVPARRLAAPGAAGALRPAGRGAGRAAPGRRRTTRRIRPNALGPAGWPPLLARCRAARPTRCSPGWRRAATRRSTASWPPGRDGLPRGHIHADLFPDNVFFLDGELSGLIDFYFAATDLLAYDVAVCLNAWCFEPDFQFNVTKARALLRGLCRRCGRCRRAERAALPVLCQGAALRFLLTRLYDWVNTPPGAMVTRKDPLEYLRRLRFHLPARDAACLWHSETTAVRRWWRSGPMAAASPTPARAAGRRSCASAASSGS